VSPSDFLLEIGTEEIPARFIPGALSQLAETATRLLQEQAIGHGRVQTFGTPRRLTLQISEMAARQEDRTRQIMGPSVRAAYGADGKPTRAAEGFARGQGVPLESLQVVPTERGDYIAAVLHEKGRDTLEVMPQVAPQIIRTLSFPKSMRWGSGSFRFARPIHWVLALFGAAPVRFELDGLRSSNLTRGHRFLSPEDVTVPEPAAYLAVLRERFVVADPEERKEIIRAEIRRMGQEAGGRVVEDEELLETVTNLVEFPVPMLGRFEDKYLELPRELLVTVMKGHQKYFAVEDEKGPLLPYFITVSNSAASNRGNVVAGNERVLRARLEDARFYFEDDRATPLESRVKDLKAVTYQIKLGSVHDKIERVTAIARKLHDRLGFNQWNELLQVCSLAKADLTTGVVYEFPELQGYMGMVYARQQGLKDEVAHAIYEHYMPRFSGDKIPDTDLGAVASLADKIDSVVAFFSVGLVPTGSEDPFALRRQALGVLAILDGRGYGVSPAELVDMALAALPSERATGRETRDKVLDFVSQRLYVLLAGEGHRQDDVLAVLATPYTSLRDVRARLAALSGLRSGRTFSDLVMGAKRVYNILGKNRGAESVQEGLLQEAAEQKLFRTVQGLSGLDGSQASRLSDLVDPINGFFDQVLVMDKDESLKNNRLALLAMVRELFGRVADFSKITE